MNPHMSLSAARSMDAGRLPAATHAAGVGPSGPRAALQASRVAGAGEILSAEAVAFVADLHARFDPTRQALLQARDRRCLRIRAGERPDFDPQSRALRESDWQIAPIPPEVLDRRVEITGPVDRKMIVNALSSGASVYMADFEDSTSPTWDNLIAGQRGLFDAVRRQLRYRDPATGKEYRFDTPYSAWPTVLMVRPRGLHLPEKHLQIDGQSISGALFDFGLFLFHNAHALCAQGTRPYFYLPKLESAAEARLWRDVFAYSEERLRLAPGTIRATVLIETLPAAFVMDEILWELREYILGLNCGRWDYIFSFIKTLAGEAASILPDRGLVTMAQPFLSAYSQLLIQTCHRRGAHAMGGMAAQIPIKNDAAAHQQAMARVQADKAREVQAGHDGTWVAHPALVPLATAIFDEHMPRPNQIARLQRSLTISASELLRAPPGPRSEAGLRQNLRVGVQYLAAWLAGQGCVPLYNLMEDAATAEISRAQIWQWQHHRALVEGQPLTAGRVRETLQQELRGLPAADEPARAALQSAGELFYQLATGDELIEFLTLPAYERL